MLRRLIGNNALPCDRYRNALTFCLFFQQNWNWSLESQVWCLFCRYSSHPSLSASQTAKSLSRVFSGRDRISQFETFASRFLSTIETSLLCEFHRKYKPFFVAFYFVFKKDKRFRFEQTHTAILLCSRKRIIVFYCETRDFFVQISVWVTYLLTYSMVQSPSWEANWFAASQEIPRISRNPKVHYCTHKRPPSVSILGQPNPVHIPSSHLLEIHPNIIHPSTPRSPQWSPSLRFPHQDPYTPSPPHAQPISFFSILSSTQYWVRSTSHLAPRYVVSSIPPLPHPS